MRKKAAFPCHLKAIVPCGRIYGEPVEVDTTITVNFTLLP